MLARRRFVAPVTAPADPAAGSGDRWAEALELIRNLRDELEQAADEYEADHDGAEADEMRAIVARADDFLVTSGGGRDI